MRKFKIECLHDVCEDSFSHGESNHVHSYNTEAEINSESWQQAVESFFADTLYYDFDINLAAVDEEGDGLFYDCLVDENNSQATSLDIAHWRKGAKNLYSNNMKIYVYELTAVNLKA